MATKIIHKKSSVSSSVPSPSDLEPGEIAVNLADQKIYSKTTGGVVIELAPNSAAGDLLASNNLSDVDNAGTARTNLGVGTGDTPTFAGIDITGTATVGGDIDVNGTKISLPNKEKTDLSADGDLGFDSSQGLLVYRTQQGVSGASAAVTVLDGANVAAGTGVSITNLGAGGSGTQTFTFSIGQAVGTSDSPTFAGLSTTDDITFGDNNKAIFGAGSDLSIYHDGSNSHIEEAGTGDLKISGNNLWLEDASGNTYFRAVNGSYAKMYYSGAEKLATTTSGIDITGNAAVSGKAKVGTGADGHGNGDELVLSKDQTNVGMSLLAADATGVCRILLGSQSATTAAKIQHSESNSRLFVQAEGELYLQAGGTSTKAIINSSGYMGVGTTSPGTTKLAVETSATSDALSTLSATSTSYASDIFTLSCARSGNLLYNFLVAESNTSGSADTEFILQGDGNAKADGSWLGGGADYAEYFEWSDGNPSAEDRVGFSVVLDGDKLRKAVAGEEPLGVISGNPSVVGDSDIDRWKGKYLKDDFGRYLWEDYEAVSWTEPSEDEDEDDISYSYPVDAIPEGLVPPEDAERVIQKRRKLNPDHNPDLEYIPRSERPEWDTVGLVGKLRIRKGQPTGSNWVKMRDVSADVEEWFIK